MFSDVLIKYLGFFYFAFDSYVVNIIFPEYLAKGMHVARSETR